VYVLRGRLCPKCWACMGIDRFGPQRIYLPLDDDPPLVAMATGQTLEPRTKPNSGLMAGKTRDT
jgi:hypothetical protein